MTRPGHRRGAAWLLTNWRPRRASGGRELWEAMQPFSTGGVYVNYLEREADGGAERVKAAYGFAKYERLVILKNKYDPTNVFRLNQNIKPTV
jgi:Berberine and berberine like